MAAGQAATAWQCAAALSCASRTRLSQAFRRSGRPGRKASPPFCCALFPRSPTPCRTTIKLMVSKGLSAFGGEAWKGSAPPAARRDPAPRHRRAGRRRARRALRPRPRLSARPHAPQRDGRGSPGPRRPHALRPARPRRHLAPAHGDERRAAATRGPAGRRRGPPLPQPFRRRSRGAGTCVLPVDPRRARRVGRVHADHAGGAAAGTAAAHAAVQGHRDLPRVPVGSALQQG